MSVTEDLRCLRCGREQPVLHSPCPACGLLGSTSSIPHTPAADDGKGSANPPEVWGGDVDPSKPMSRELSAAFARAHRAWAGLYAPWLLEGWLA
jgi:hypothetical protein